MSTSRNMELDQKGCDLPFTIQNGGAQRLSQQGLAIQAQGALSLIEADEAWLNANQEFFLSSFEHNTVQATQNPARRQSLLIGRYTAKRALRLIRPDLSWQRIKIQNGDHGEPLIKGDDVPPLTLSLSHCDAMAFAAIVPNSYPLGVDIERLRPDLIETLTSHFKERELALMPGELAWSQDQKLLALWCLKEALAKALKTGFTLPYEQLEIASLSDEDGWLSARFGRLPAYQAQCLFAGDLCLAIAFSNPGRFEIDRERLCRALEGKAF